MVAILVDVPSKQDFIIWINFVDLIWVNEVLQAVEAFRCLCILSPVIKVLIIQHVVGRFG